MLSSRSQWQSGEALALTEDRVITAWEANESSDHRAAASSVTLNVRCWRRVQRIWFTPQQKSELWERWKSGQCIAAIARTLGRRNKSGVYRILAFNGAIVPTPRR